MALTQSPAPTTLVQSHIWSWQNLTIRYQQAGDQGSSVILVHGFGGSSDHWRKNLPILAQTHRVYAIDLLGFGQSAKPGPGQPLDYCFETWSQQIIDFCQQVVGEPSYLVGNSIGCIAVLQVAVQDSSWAKGVAILNCSLRLLHEHKRSTLPWHQQIGTPIIQAMLGFRPLGHLFFGQIAQARVLRNILCQAYGRQEAVTDELVELLLGPAQDVGAADVFLAFVRYSQGPLAEDLLPQLSCPALILWGEEDPWESIHLGRELAQFPAVEQFIPLPGVGHCPQDEAPELVNPLLRDWFLSHG
jgi:pimeloyl-ACP methyl ester carboxylesterase